LTDGGGIHEAIAAELGDGDFLVQWVYVADVMAPDGTRSIVTEGGGGPDGGPAAWVVMGLLHAGVAIATDQLMHPDDYDLDEDD
jgi:hypothetical protein